MNTHKEGETTPNNKSWAGTMYTKEFEDAVVNITTKGLNKMVSQFPGYVAEQIEKVVKAERERVLSGCRQRVIDECIEKCSFFISRNLEKNPYDTAWNDAANAIVERLNQLKEE